MIAESLVDQAKDDLNAFVLFVTVAGVVIAIFGPRLLDEGHRIRRNGYLAIGAALIGLGLTVSQLVLMAGLVWSSITGNGSFQPWLLLAVMYFVVAVIIALALVWLLCKAIAYTAKAGED